MPDGATDPGKGGMEKAINASSACVQGFDLGHGAVAFTLRREKVDWDRGSVERIKNPVHHQVPDVWHEEGV